MEERDARILIVDDDSEIRSILQEFLSRTHSCVGLDSADKALALLKVQPFDVVISDIRMAQMTGLEMLPHIAALAPDSVVVMVSGQRTIDSAIEAMRAGAFDYITKPFELSEVAAVVERALDRARHLKASRANGNGDARAIELSQAIERDDFVVYYQPQFEIQSRRIVGAEALVRWQHPQLGLVPPADFISLAEEVGAIVRIGERVLRTACAQTRLWQDAGADAFRIAVNASPRQLREPDFPDLVAEVLAETKLAAECLEIEVTETSLVENAESGIRTLTQLRDMGVRIAIDDFGTGYSSLGYLKRLPIHTVKLDASFVKDATNDADDAALVMAIITLAHNLRKKVIAEGIEREDQLAFLRLLRCDEGQGFLIGRPAPALDDKIFPNDGVLNGATKSVTLDTLIQNN
jgi:EAL domain-containing protein (putative c-di-GMP-specific phosphodiesterase class I)/CheY-like chemotaxis protein